MPMHFKDRKTTTQALADAGLGPTIDASLQLEDAINAAHLPLDQEIGVWSVEQHHGTAAAQRVLTAIKEAKSPALMRQKASNPLALACQQLQTAYAAGDQPGAQTALQQIITMVMPTAGTTGARLSDDQKAAAKSTDARFVNDFGQPLARQVR